MEKTINFINLVFMLKFMEAVDFKVTKMKKNVIIYDPNKVKEEDLINGVKIMELKRNIDDRGWNSEIWHSFDIEEFVPGMLIDMYTNGGMIKAFHVHREQDDVFYVMEGHAKIVLVDLRPNSSTYGLANTINCSRDWSRAIFIPRGVAHGYEAITDMRMVYLVSRDHYKPDDEKKMPPGSKEFKIIGYNDWGIRNR